MLLQGSTRAWEGQWSGQWAWFSVSGPAVRWLVGNGGAYQWTGPPGMWPCCSPTHFKKEQRPTRGWGGSEPGTQEMKGALLGNLP